MAGFQMSTEVLAPECGRQFREALLGSDAGDEGGWHVFCSDADAHWNKYVSGRAGSPVASLG